MIAYALSTLVFLLFSGYAMAELHCRTWYASDFWETVTVEEISRCLTTGMDLEGRNTDGYAPAPGDSERQPGDSRC